MGRASQLLARAQVMPGVSLRLVPRAFHEALPEFGPDHTDVARVLFSLGVT